MTVLFGRSACLFLLSSDIGSRIGIAFRRVGAYFCCAITLFVLWRFSGIAFKCRRKRADKGTRRQKNEETK